MTKTRSDWPPVIQGQWIEPGDEWFIGVAAVLEEAIVDWLEEDENGTTLQTSC